MLRIRFSFCNNPSWSLYELDKFYHTQVYIIIIYFYTILHMEELTVDITLPRMLRENNEFVDISAHLTVRPY